MRIREGLRVHMLRPGTWFMVILHCFYLEREIERGGERAIGRREERDNRDTYTETQRDRDREMWGRRGEKEGECVCRSQGDQRTTLF